MTRGSRCVIIKGEGGKAFCAGADIRILYDLGKAGRHAEQLSFWREEYRLNHRIKLYPKPYITLASGIVMGGGAGLSMHGSHVIAGEDFTFAMPETGIGFFPDVGATFFLPRLPALCRCLSRLDQRPDDAAATRSALGLRAPMFLRRGTRGLQKG